MFVYVCTSVCYCESYGFDIYCSASANIFRKVSFMFALCMSVGVCVSVCSSVCVCVSVYVCVCVWLFVCGYLCVCTMYMYVLLERIKCVFEL